MVVGVTGHRLGPRIGGYGNQVCKKLIEIADKNLKKLDVEEVIHGGALGWDQACAIAAIRLGITTTIAIPFEGQERKWPENAQKRYRKIIDKSDNVVFVNKGSYDVLKMQDRNEWIVNMSDLILAYWDGEPSGTKNCLDYAEQKGVKIINCYNE